MTGSRSPDGASRPSTRIGAARAKQSRRSPLNPRAGWASCGGFSASRRRMRPNCRLTGCRRHATTVDSRGQWRRGAADADCHCQVTWNQASLRESLLGGSPPFPCSFPEFGPELRPSDSGRRAGHRMRPAECRSRNALRKLAVCSELQPSSNSNSQCTWPATCEPPAPPPCVKRTATAAADARVSTMRGWSALPKGLDAGHTPVDCRPTAAVPV